MTVTGTPIIVAIISSAPGLIVSIATLVSVMQNKKKVQEVHLSINGQMEEFKELIAKSSFAKGVKSETDKWPNSHRVVE